ncbi:MAG TPA: GGDEF domain-containing protein [Marinagarivorans sp.]
MWWGAYTDAVAGGNTTFTYVDESQSEIKCRIGDVGSFKLCGNSAVFAESTVFTRERLASDHDYAMAVSSDISVDFSDYLGVWLNVEYEGPADFIYVLLQNHEPSMVTTDPDRQFRPQSVGVSTSELTEPVYISLNDFKVADWWVTRFSLHRTKAGVNFDRIFAFGVEIKDQPAGSNHRVKVKSITFVREWISRENFYFCIIVSLTTLLLLEVALRVYGLYVRQRLAQKSLEELSVQNKRLQSAAYKDELTQLLNRRAIHEVVLKNWEVKKYQPIAILVIDIDNFKTFNDTYGHALGDTVLAEVACALQSVSRDCDHIARWGGEEFVIITKKESPEKLKAYAQKLRKKIASTEIQSEHCLEKLSVTISIGITVTGYGERFEQAFARADAALYQSKKMGRNCCTFS